MSALEQRRYRFKLNGKAVTVSARPAASLLDVLRNTLDLTGTKNGCSKGDCGACTILMNGAAVNACLTIMEQTRGADIVTIEGLAEDPRARRLLKSFAQEGAVQCGYCTPGIVMASRALLLRNSSPSAKEIREALRGNLCRCTGYGKVIKAVLRTRS
jgi:carbon-monoxide dehydrogenase small subunit